MPAIEKKTKTKAKTWPRVKAVRHKNGQCAWMVDGRIKGKGERLFFKTKGHANTKAQQLRVKRTNEGLLGIDIPDQLRSEALHWDKKLKEVGASIAIASKYYLEHAMPKGGKQTSKDLLKQMLEAKRRAGRRESYVKALEWSLGVFNRTFGHRYINEISESEIETWLGERNFSLPTRKAYLRDIHILFAYAHRKDHCAENPIAKIERPVLEEKEVEILAVSQVESLLRASEKSPELQMQVPLAIAVFAGLRPKQELAQLDWSDVNIDTDIITVRGRSAKDRRMRHVSIQTNLKTWLTRHKREAGRVLAYGFRGYLERLRKLRSTAGIQNWPRDVLRHCFASYHLAQFQDVSVTQTQLGHAAKSSVLWEHYRALVSKTDATRFWSISPLPKRKRRASKGPHTKSGTILGNGPHGRSHDVRALPANG